MSFYIDAISQIGPIPLVVENFLSSFCTCSAEFFSRAGTEAKELNDEFDDHLACLVYHSTRGVFSNGKFLATQSNQCGF